MSNLHVICKVADADYAVAADQVDQMESYEGATPVPGAPPYVAGLVQIRQRIIPVLDLRARFGLPDTERTLGCRVLVMRQGERTFGVVVDSAREVCDIAPDQIRPPPDVIATQSAGFVKSVAQLQNRIVLLLDFAKVAGEENAHGSHG
jgi:purine-binding chemotaxis protein CheW